MEYNHIKDYLEKVKNILFSKEENIQIIIEVIKINTGVALSSRNISVKGTSIYIKASPLVKNEILIKKEKILNNIKIIAKNLNILEIK